jgi:hypothetical protein
MEEMNGFDAFDTCTEDGVQVGANLGKKIGQ